MVHSLDGDANFFDIVTGVLEGNIFELFLSIIYLDYILLISIDLKKENGLTLKKAKSRQYHSETITDADYSDDLALLANIPAQAESLLHRLEQASRGIGLYVNSDTTVYSVTGVQTNLLWCHSSVY